MVPRNKKNQKIKLLQQYKQPTIRTWLNKLAITQHLKQTKNTWKIHTPDQKITTHLENKWKNEWNRHKEILNNTTPNPEQKETAKQYIYQQQGKKHANISTKSYLKTKQHPLTRNI